jgi:hypothetical protein
VAGLIAFGCAKPTEDVPAAFVSPGNYQNFSCAQLAETAKRVSQRAVELSGINDRKPELARLQCELGAIKAESQEKGCATKAASRTHAQG